MKSTKIGSIGLFVAMVLPFSQRASAQDYSIYNKMFSNMLSNRIWDSIYSQSSPGYAAAKKKLSGSKSKPSTQSSTPSAQASTPIIPEYRRYPSVQFKPTGTRLTLAEYIDAVKLEPKEKAELKVLVQNIWDEYETIAAAKGYPNDLALAIVSFIGLNARVYAGAVDKPLLPFEQNFGLRDMVAESADQNGTFNKMTDRQKQEMYEVLVMLGGITYYYYEKFRMENNAEELKSLRRAAGQNLEMLGIKP